MISWFSLDKFQWITLWISPLQVQNIHIASMSKFLLEQVKLMKNLMWMIMNLTNTECVHSVMKWMLQSSNFITQLNVSTLILYKFPAVLFISVSSPSMKIYSVTLPNHLDSLKYFIDASMNLHSNTESWIPMEQNLRFPFKILINLAVEFILSSRKFFIGLWAICMLRIANFEIQLYQTTSILNHQIFILL